MRGPAGRRWSTSASAIDGDSTYTITGRGQVPQRGTTASVLAAFGHCSKAHLQTCIPRTSQTLLIALD